MTGKQLKNSILQWAIQGKLVPQDPNDEPASVLLEKIRQEKERLIKEKKIKRDKNASIIFRGEDNSYYEKFADGKVVCIDDEIPFEIPQGWEWCRLNNYSDVRDGTHDSPQYVFSGYPLITSKDFIGGKFDFSKTKYIDENTFIEINKRSNVQIGDILFSMIGGNIGSMILITKENYFDMAIKNVALFKQYIYNDIIIKYLYFYLQSQVVNIRNTAFGGAQSFVPLNMLRNYLMPIPPLNEQKKIIEKFKSIDFVIQQYEKAYCELINLKQELYPKLNKSILQEAIQGKLVPQIAEEGTARELLEQIRQEKQKLVKEGKLKKTALTDSIIYKGDDNRYYEKIDQQCKDITEEIPFEIPENWEWCRMQNVINFINGRAYKKEELLDRGKYKVLRVGNFFTNIEWYYSDLELPEDKYCYNGDLLYAWSASFGPQIWEGDKTIFHYHIWNVKYDPRLLYREYLYYFFLYDKTQIKKATTGSTMIHVSMENMKLRLLPIPPLQEQQRIVAQIERLFEQLK